MDKALKHVAIIPDGNRRWAKQKGVPSMEGHRKAFEQTLPSLLRKAADLGVQYFTFWALSTENYIKRAKDEIDGLLSLGKLFHANKLNQFIKEGVKVQFIGDIASLKPDTQRIIADTTQKTKDGEKITLIIAINYGGKDEVIRALHKVINMNYLAKTVTKDNFDQFLDTNGLPDPDLIIRTGGEQRLSGLYPWQSVYSELYFSDILFPDFGSEELEKAVKIFYTRKRRFGQ